MKLSFYGADQCVTGSCHCLEVNGKKILVDCGLQQGRDEIDNAALPFHPGSIDVVLVTHAHIDHSGRIPMLIKNGFQGRIITTRLTADLLDIMLQDSAHIQEQDVVRSDMAHLLSVHLFLYFQVRTSSHMQSVPYLRHLSQTVQHLWLPHVHLVCH